MVNSNNPQLRQVIRDRRQQKNMTQAEVAKSVGVSSPEFIGMVEAGTRRIDLDKVPTLAGILDLDRKDLVAMALSETHPLAYKELFGKKIPKATNGSNKDQVDLSAEETDLIQKFRGLPKEAQVGVTILVDQMHEMQNRSLRSKL